MANLLLLLLRKVNKMIILRAHQKRNSRLIEPPPLPIPLLDTIQRALPRQVKHEQYRHRIIAHQRQHIHKLALPAQVPDGERNLCVADADGLLHEVDAQRLDVVFVPGALDVLDHEAGFADLGVADHADFDDDAVIFLGRGGGLRLVGCAAARAF